MCWGSCGISAGGESFDTCLPGIIQLSFIILWAGE